MSSIFRNSNRKYMNIEKKTIKEHFNNNNNNNNDNNDNNNNKLSIGRSKFSKKCRDDMYVKNL